MALPKTRKPRTGRRCLATAPFVIDTTEVPEDWRWFPEARVGTRDMKEENVLIIDSDPDSTSVLSQLIGTLGHQFRVVSDPKTALSLLGEESFSLVLADGSLLDKEQTLAIQAHHPHTGVIFTADSLERFADSLDPGACDFLSKPLCPEETEFRVRRMFFDRDRRLRNREAEEELEAARDELERKKRELELSVEDLERIKHLYKEIGSELTATSEKLRHAKDQLEVLAITDGLTEVYNHRYFMDQLHDKFEAAEKQTSPLSLLMIDIDHFKAFNDNHGHMTGDLILRNIAQILKSTCREEDIVARYGGEEFAIILPGTNSEQAERLAEEIRTAVESYKLPNGEDAPRVTVSIGVGAKDGGIDSVDQLISSADQALYRAKAGGRNRFAYGEKIHPKPEVPWFSRF